MNEQENKFKKKIMELVVNDYFTPNIRTEVILDCLLTEYIAAIVKAQLKNQVDGTLTFLTKEMSINDGRGDNRGTKIDYVLEGDTNVYMVELKTTKGSINTVQAEQYTRNFCGKTFGEALGNKLLELLTDKFKNEDGKSWEVENLAEEFKARVKGCSANKAKEYLQDNKKASTHKYLYTAGQILEHHSGEMQDLWEKPLRLIYLTTDGGRVFPKKSRKKEKQEWEEIRLKWKKLYVGPNGTDSSVSLATAREYLGTEEKDDFARLLYDILGEIYGKN